MEIKNVRGAGAAYEFVASIAWSDREDDFKRFLAIRLIPFVADGDESTERAASAEIFSALGRQPQGSVLLGLLASMAGLGFQEGYTWDASTGVRLQLFPIALTCDTMRLDPAETPLNAYTWSFRPSVELSQHLLLAVRQALSSDDADIRQAGLQGAMSTPLSDLQETVMGLAKTDPDLHVRSLAVEILSRLPTRQAAQGLLLAAETDASELVRRRALELLPGTVHDKAALADFLLNRATKETHEGTAEVALATLLDIFKASRGDELLPHVEEVLRRRALADHARLASFIDSVGVTFDERLLPLLESVRGLTHSRVLEKKLNLAQDRLTNPEKYRRIRARVVEVEGEIRQLGIQMNQPGLQPQDWAPLNSRQQQLMEELDALHRRYSSPEE